MKYRDYTRFIKFQCIIKITQNMKIKEMTDFKRENQWRTTSRFCKF